MSSLSSIKVENKVAICYTCTTRIVREIVLWQLTNKWFDHDNIYYFIITDDASTFNQCSRKNLIINTIEDYDVHPVEKPDSNQPFSFSLFRFHLQQVKEYGITNIGMFCADSNFREVHYNNIPVFEQIFNKLTCNPKSFYNHVNAWKLNSITGNIKEGEINPTYRELFLGVLNFLKSQFNWEPKDEYITIADAAVRFFNFENIEDLDIFFNIWDTTIHSVYKDIWEDLFLSLSSGTILNDEYILGPIYNMVGLKWNLERQNELVAFESHHKIMLLNKIDEATIDLNKSLEENFKTYYPNLEYLIS